MPMHPKSHLLIPTPLTKFLLARRWLAPALALAAMVVSAASASAQTTYFYSLAGDPGYNFTGSPPNVNMVAAIQTILGKPITSVGSLVDANSAYPPVLADTFIAPFYTYGPTANGVVKNLQIGTVILSGIVRGDLLYIGNETACTLSFSKYILRAYTATQYYDILVKVSGCAYYPPNPSTIAAVWSFYQVSGSRPINPYTLAAVPNYYFGLTEPVASTMGFGIATRLGKPVSVVSSLPGENTAFPPTLGDSGTGFGYSYGPSSGGVIRNLTLSSNVLTGIVSSQIRFAGTQVVGGTAFNKFVLRVFTATQFSDILVRVITNDAISAVWDFYQISALRPISGTLTNLSARAQVLTGQNVEIAGFIINGSGFKQVLIRGLGPSVAVPGNLADPTLSLYNSSGGLIYSNNNWKDTQQAAIQSTGLQPTNDLESAILIKLNPGAYSAILAGNGGGTGIGVAELYDISGTAQLVNLSARANVGTGINVLIGGLIAQSTSGGPGVIVRAIGPSLAQQGIVGAMQDPTLELHDGNGALIASNNNWQDTQSTDIQATGVAPTDYRESAILTDLVPGAYTAIVSGVGGTTGVAAVEVYRVP
jgi:hypothetical protein